MKYIYLFNIENTDVYKIGFTKQHPSKRLKDLQTGNPYKMVLVDSYQSPIAPKIESVMHSYFKHQKVHEEYGIKLIGEWFGLSKETVKDFQKSCKKIEDNLNSINKELY